MSTAELNICDPHFHVWDVNKRPNPNLGDIGAPGAFPTFYPEDYFTAMKGAGNLRSGVHVETVVGQMDGGAVLDPLGETKWLAELADFNEFPLSVVAYAHLGRPGVNEALQAHKSAHSKIRGIRMILNHHPSNSALTWPQVEHGNFLKDAQFTDGYATLQKHEFSFDLQANPHQLLDAAALFSQYKSVPVAVNHMACLHLGQSDAEDEKSIATWRDGLKALANLPHVSMKLSMLDFCEKDWWQSDEGEASIGGLVQEVIGLFGCDRCMFASNMPVDQFVGGEEFSIGRIYAAFKKMSSRYGAEAQKQLFHDTAAKFYHLPL